MRVSSVELSVVLLCILPPCQLVNSTVQLQNPLTPPAACADLIKALHECHNASVWNRFIGGCNDQKQALNMCLRQEVSCELATGGRQAVLQLVLLCTTTAGIAQYSEHAYVSVSDGAAARIFGNELRRPSTPAFLSHFAPQLCQHDPNPNASSASTAPRVTVKTPRTVTRRSTTRGTSSRRRRPLPTLLQQPSPRLRPRALEEDETIDEAGGLGNTTLLLCIALITLFFFSS